MSKEGKSWFYLILLAIIWGSSFILMKKGMYTDDGQDIFSDTQVASIRMIIAGVVLLPFAFKSLKKIKDFKLVLLLLVVGFFGNFFPAFLYTYAETGVSSGYTGMLTSFTPIFALTIGFLLFKDRLAPVQIVGVMIGVVGVILLMIAGKDLELNGEWSHLFAIVLATLFYGISLNTIKHKLHHLKSMEIASLSFFLVLTPSIIAGATNGTVDVIITNEFALEGLFYIAILSVIGTAFALIVFNKMIALSSVLFASSVTYLIPIVAVLIGLYFGEKISIFQVGSMFIVLLGVFIANILGKKKSIA